MLFFAVAALVLGGVCVWLVAQISPAERAAAGVGGMAALAAAAIGVAAFHATAARLARQRTRQVETSAELLEQEVRWLAEDLLPALGRRLHHGATVPDALATVAQPSHPVAQRLRQVFGQALETERRTRAEAVTACSAMDSELRRLAEQQLPILVKGVRAGQGATDLALAEVMRPSQPSVRHLWAQITRELESGNRQGAAAMAACADAAARIQAQVTSLLGWLRELQDACGEQEEIFGQLLEADHRVSQMGRIADNIALLSGGRSGRRWTKPIVMESVLRGAIGRIGAYRRVQLHCASTAAIAGYAAEGVMHALAELVDNATKFSADNTRVHLYVEDEDAGLVVTVEDSGLGMRSRERRLAETLISRPLDLTMLPGTRLGLAAVGRLCGKYGLTVSLRPSARGGIGVVLLIPRQLIMYPRVEEPPADQAPPRPRADAVTTVVPRHDSASGDIEQAALPKRPRGQTLLAASQPPAAAVKAPGPRTRDGAAERLAAFRQASSVHPDAGAPSQDSPPPHEDGR
ncbi:sensor histidine kinase [Nonomuraea insulae]|uniref:histidine kinase n=1 Tax=Nonomuraea insulae TaxID=1616787 RepID=A0ABW1D9I0_9ACTN